MPNPARRVASQSRVIIVGTTVLLGLTGIVTIFAPAELAVALGSADTRSTGLVLQVALQLYGAALLGLAMTGWMVKDSIVGGIFGRSYVAGNLGHAFVGALVLIRPAFSAGATPVLVVTTVVYWLLAIAFGYLMFMATPSA